MCDFANVLNAGYRIYHNNWALLVFLIKPPSSILLIIIYFCIIYSVYCWSRLFPRDGLEYCWCSSRDLCNSSPESILSKQYFVHALNAALLVTLLWCQKRERIFVVYLEIKWPNGRLKRIADVMFQIHILTSKFCPIRKPHHIMLYELCVSLTHAISQSFVGYDLKHLLYSKCILSRQADHFDQHDHQTTPIRTINCKICNKFGQNHTLQYNIVRKMRLER